MGAWPQIEQQKIDGYRLDMRPGFFYIVLSYVGLAVLFFGLELIVGCAQQPEILDRVPATAPEWCAVMVNLQIPR